jgi:hypothetical protein
MALGSTQPLTEMSTRNLPGRGFKGWPAEFEVITATNMAITVFSVVVPCCRRFGRKYCLSLLGASRGSRRKPRKQAKAEEAGLWRYASCFLEPYLYTKPLGVGDSCKKPYRLSQRARSTPSAVGTRVRHRLFVAQTVTSSVDGYYSCSLYPTYFRYSHPRLTSTHAGGGSNTATISLLRVIGGDERAALYQGV